MAGSDHVRTSHRAAVTFSPPSHCASFPAEAGCTEMAFAVSVGCALSRRPRTSLLQLQLAAGDALHSAWLILKSAKLLPANLAALSLLLARNFVHG